MAAVCLLTALEALERGPVDDFTRGCVIRDLQTAADVLTAADIILTGLDYIARSDLLKRAESMRPDVLDVFQRADALYWRIKGTAGTYTDADREAWEAVDNARTEASAAITALDTVLSAEPGTVEIMRQLMEMAANGYASAGRSLQDAYAALQMDDGWRWCE